MSELPPLARRDHMLTHTNAIVQKNQTHSRGGGAVCRKSVDVGRGRGEKRLSGLTDTDRAPYLRPLYSGHLESRSHERYCTENLWRGRMPRTENLSTIISRGQPSRPREIAVGAEKATALGPSLSLFVTRFSAFLSPCRHACGDTSSIVHSLSTIAQPYLLYYHRRNDRAAYIATIEMHHRSY